MLRLLWLALPLSALAAAADAPEPLFEAARAGNPAAIRKALRSGADPNSRDALGATPLMYATAYAPVACMRILLSAGASPNAATHLGYTPLMWSLSDPARVRLLLSHKAEVNARTKDGHTALILARQNAFRESIPLLLAAGAGPEDGASPQVQAVLDSPLDVFLEMRSTGFEPMHVAPRSPLYLPTHATARSDSATRRLLEAGVDPNMPVNVRALDIPAVAMAATMGNIHNVRVLLDRGADPNARGTAGVTPLMAAALSDWNTAEIIAALLKSGARLDAEDESGRTALDYALLQGRTANFRTLSEAGARSRFIAPPAPPAVRQPLTPSDAVRKALDVVLPSGPVFFKRTGCVSCHHHSLPQIAARRALAKGIAVNAELAAHPAKATIAMWRPVEQQLIAGATAIPGLLANVSYALAAFADEGIKPDSVTAAAALAIARLQLGNGSWNISDLRPPIGVSTTKWTALTARSIDVYLPPGMAAEKEARIRRARAFLSEATSLNTQDQAFQLLGLKWTGAPTAAIALHRDRLLALQRSDGGWSQRAEMESDAYATGQALFALHDSGVPASHPAYGRGVRYLLSTQTADGSWFVRTRALGFQPYFETGFPHGKSQFISVAATAWAAIALTAAVEQPAPQGSPRAQYPSVTAQTRRHTVIR